ncbi:MAG TPA: tyrosine-type recombinase/integrase, partial [Pirellulales bacterium]
LGRVANVADLEELTIAGWIESMLSSALARRTINGRLNMLLTLWRMAKRKKFVDSDLTDLRKVKMPRRAPQAWSSEQMGKIIESCRQCKGRFVGVPCDRWWLALVLLIYDTGLRRSAAMKVRFDEIDFRRKVLRVPAERMKNLVEQTFPLTDQTLEAIMATVPPRRKLLFPYPSRDQKTIYGRFKFILMRAGLSATRRDLFQKIRRTTATHIAAAAGESAAIRQLGHQDTLTIKRYIDPTFMSDHDLAKYLPRPGWNDPKRVEVELVDVPDTSGLPLAKIRRRLKDYAGKDGSSIEQLMRKPFLSADDVAEALDCIGVLYRDFAPYCGLKPRALARVLNGKRPILPHLERKIRVALGLSYEQGEQVPEGPRNRKRDARKVGAA